MKTLINTNRAELIEQIIQRRREFSTLIERDRAHLEACKLALINLQSNREELLAAKIDPISAKRLGEIDFSLLAQIEPLLAQLEQLRHRTARDTLNIAVIGYPHQGKSRLVCSLTGLDHTVIPNGGQGHCTGTISIIRHQPGLTSPQALVNFYTWDEFRDRVLAPYYQSLDLGCVPTTMSEFAQTPPPGLAPEKRNNETDKARYGHLRKNYYSNLPSYGHLLNSAALHISAAEIPQYVTQNISNFTGEKLVNYLAVKQVEISCSIPGADIGNIVFIDLPGFDDTNFIDAERIMASVGSEVDFVLFVRRPETDAIWEESHISLYQKVSEALGVSLADSAFIVLNHSEYGTENSDNGYWCQKLQAELIATPIQVLECAIADCSDPQEVNTQVLSPILNYLLDGVEYTNREYAGSCQTKLNQIYAQVSHQIDIASVALAEYTNTDILFEQLFEQFWHSLTNDLENLLKYCENHKHDVDREFEEHFEQAIANCKADSGIPTVAEIEKSRNLFGSYSSAYNQYLHYMRTHFLGHFLQLDREMHRAIENRKTLVAKVLKTSLGELSATQGIEFMSAIANMLPENATNLKLGLQNLCNFNVSFAGKVQRQLRQNLDNFQPDANKFPLLGYDKLYLEPVDQINSDATFLTQEELILDALEEIHFQSTLKTKAVLNQMLCEPNQEAYFMVEEFVDRVLRSKGVQLEWRIFLRRVSLQVWSDFPDIEKRLQQQQIWRILVERVREVIG